MTQKSTALSVAFDLPPTDRPHRGSQALQTSGKHLQEEMIRRRIGACNILHHLYGRVRKRGPWVWTLHPLADSAHVRVLKTTREAR